MMTSSWWSRIPVMRALPQRLRAALARQTDPDSFGGDHSPRREAAGRQGDVRKSGPRPAASDSQSLVETMLQQGRYALLMRPQIASNLSDEQYDRALAALSDGMTLTPEGEVLLRGRSTFGSGEEDTPTGKLVRVEAMFLDRFAVTNDEYQRFVQAGGYEQMSLWSPEIWPGVLHFVDQTGQPGPRFWRYGGCRAGQERHPVVGVSWYEACAYARWVGKRLPTDAEWVKAGSWPVASPGGPPIQRKYPWGETMDRRRANLWGSGANSTAPVDDYEDGASISGVYQLVGNVWEWTSSSFGAWDPPAKRLELATPMKSIRGGAFDTYFDGHAACQFQSGESPVERRHNIGFRCAVGVCDLALRSTQGQAEDDLDIEGMELEGVA